MIRRALILSVAILAVAAPVLAQSEPYRVFDTRPVITEGPYLVATSETTVTIVWRTDTPSHAEVRYGPGSDLSMVAQPQLDGLVPVGTRHVVHLNKQLPGSTRTGRTKGWTFAAGRTNSLRSIVVARRCPSASSQTRMRIQAASID